MAYRTAFVMSLICAALQTSAQERSAKQNRVRAEIDNLLYHFTDMLSLRDMRRSKASCLNPRRQDQDPRPFALKKGTSHSKTKAHYPSRRKTKIRVQRHKLTAAHIPVKGTLDIVRKSPNNLSALLELSQDAPCV